MHFRIPSPNDNLTAQPRSSAQMGCAMPKSNRLNPKFIFIHIPRTAGTSCQFNIVRTFGRKNVLHVYDQETSDLYVADFVGVDATKYAAITGHIPLHQVAKNDQISKRLNRSNGFIFSVVRDPFEWAISLFNYLHSPKMSNLDRKFINFSKSIPENRQCQYLSCDKIDAFQLAARHPIAPFETIEEALTLSLL